MLHNTSASHTSLSCYLLTGQRRSWCIRQSNDMHDRSIVVELNLLQRGRSPKDETKVRGPKKYTRHHHQSPKIALNRSLGVRLPQGKSSVWSETMSIGIKLYYAELANSIVSTSVAGLSKSTMSSQPTKGRSAKIRYLQRTGLPSAPTKKKGAQMSCQPAQEDKRLMHRRKP